MSVEIQITSGELYFEEDMPESQAQINSSNDLEDVLGHQYELEACFITGNLAIFPPAGTYSFQNIAPDVALFKGVTLSPAEQLRLTSWKMSEPNRPAPTVVFEISSKDTWMVDLNSKPEFYRQLGVREYFAFDPQRVWQHATTQLRGWRYENGAMLELQPNAQGHLWSEELESWLVGDGAYLRLYDRAGNLRLTAKEAERAAKEAERAAKEAATQQAELERAAKEAALRQAEAERAELQVLLEKLRKHNIDPDTL